VVFPLLMLHPRGKVSKFTIVSVVREPHLWPNEQNLLVVDDDAAVVNDVLVDDGPVSSDSGQRGKPPGLRC